MIGTGRRRAGRRQPLVATVTVLVLTVGLAGSVLAGHLAGSVKSYTGCLDSGGTLVLIKEGDAPRKPCASGAVEAHFSGGDITALTAGTGLTGGGTNGNLTISLDPKYALRQDCATGQVVKWDGDSWECANDLDTTYSAGTGLDLTGTTMSLDRDYRLPQDCDVGEASTLLLTDSSLIGEWGCQAHAYADQDCATGTFANGVDDEGALTCGTPSTTSSGAPTVYFGKTINPTQGYVEQDSVGIPDDGAERPYARVSVPAGTYLVTVKARLRSAHNVGYDDLFVWCRISGGGDAIPYISDDLNNDDFEGAFSLMTLVTTGGGVISLDCEADIGVDGIAITNVRLSALKVVQG